MVLKKKTQAKQRRQLIAYEQPKSPISEQYRNIRTNIQFSVPEGELHSLMVTSASPSEGKTTTTANLATVFAQQGVKVLLIDADLRKPSLHHMFRTDNIFGLTNVLTKRETFEKCVQVTDVENLSFLPSGAIPPNPAELLGSRYIDEFMKEVHSQYDMIIFDLPPILAVTDAQVIANKCDGVVLVVRSEKTEKEQALKAKALLENASGKLLGVVLNDKKIDENHYYYYGAN
ncbi:CpsD/CapB family tyrosine-protein kinase [Microbacteriaceae bacterium 4G12]